MNDAGKTPNIPDHELLRLIGRGSYGEVWLARNIMGTLRAVKIVCRTTFDHSRPYEREFAGLQKFEPISRTHASQLDILHIGQNQGEGYFYYVMELADNALDQDRSATDDHTIPETYRPRTLGSEMDRRGPLAPAECVELGLSLSTALAHLHKNGLVHRDIKPSNIIYVNSQVKLADIGLVSAVDATRSYVGTVGYAPYEGPGTPQADIYSLGKVLYEAATARDRQEFPELPTQISGTAKQQEEFLELNEVLIKACDEDPRRRYQTAEQMHEDLLALRSGKSLVRLRTVERRFQWARRVGVAALLLVLLITPAYLYEARQTRRVKKLATDNFALAQQAKSRAEESRRKELTARENLYAADISLVHQALQADNLRQALDVLKKQIPKPGELDLRGFEWRYLWQQCQSDELFSLAGHDQPASCVSFSPDGRLLLTGGVDNTVKVWELASHRLLATLTGDEDIRQGRRDPTHHVYVVSFSPHGDVLLTGSETALRLWDVNTFEPLRSMPQLVVKASFSSGGQYLATSGTNLVLWDTRTWSAVKTRELPEVAAGSARGLWSGLAFSPDGRRVGIVLEDGVRLLGIPNLDEQERLQDRMPSVRFVAFSPDGRTLATCTRGYEVKLWDVETRTPLRLLSGHTHNVTRAAFSPDGRRLATCSLDQTVKLWDVVSGTLVRSFKGHTEEVWDIAFARDGNLLASVSKDGAVKLWNPLPDPKQAPSLSSFLPLGFGSDGNLIGFTTNGRLTAYNLETQEKVSASRFLGRTTNCELSVSLGSLSNRGHTMALPLREKAEVEMWDLQRRQFVCSVENRRRRVLFAPEGHLLATGTSNQTVTVWQLPEGLRRCVLTNTSDPVAFSPDERILATSAIGPGLNLWRISDDRGQVAPTLLRRIVEDVCDDRAVFSPDGRTLAWGSWDGCVSLLAMPSGQETARLIGHKCGVTGLSFSPDGRTLATIADDATVRLWHVETRREMMRFATAMKDIGGSDLMFSPDGRTLAAQIPNGEECLIRVWAAPSFGEIAVAEGKEYGSLLQDPADWFAVGKALERRNRVEEAVQAFRETIRLADKDPDLESQRNRALLHRAKLLRRLGRLAEAGADNIAAFHLPARDPTLPPALIDLSRHFNRSLDQDLSDSMPVRAAFPTLPRGRQALPGCPGVEFDLRGAMRLDSKDDWAGFPNAAEGIHVQQKCRRLHFLQSTVFREAEEAIVASYIVHYTDGRTETILIRYGQHLRDWTVKADPGPLTDAKVAWTGTGPESDAVRIFVQTWENPRPETEIQSLDFVSKLTQCAPFLLAITAE